MLKLFFHDWRASTAIEFALLAGPFLLVVLATVEMGVKSFTQAEVDRVLGEVTTYLSITASDSKDAKEFTTARYAASRAPCWTATRSMSAAWWCRGACSTTATGPCRASGTWAAAAM